MKYNDFLSTVHARYSQYGTTVLYSDCFLERLKEERPDIAERLKKTGRKVRKRNGSTFISQEVWAFIKDVW